MVIKQDNEFSFGKIGSAIVNESMLTGESVPVYKYELPYNNDNYNSMEAHKNSTIFSGTFCIETRYHSKEKIPVLGLAVKTGFHTEKGNMIRSIIYAKHSSFKFHSDS